MNYKEFLKPTWQKAVIFIIVALLVMPAVLYIAKNGTFCFYSGYMNPGHCDQLQFDINTWQMLWLLLIFMPLQAIVDHELSYFVAPLVGAVISYLLASLLAHYYPKHAKRKK